MHKSKIIKLIEETHDTKTIRFEKPQAFIYKPGQYGIFEHSFGDELIRRSYSFSSSPTEEFLQITVKLMSKGIMSSYLHGLNEGDELSYNAPIGKFVFDDHLTNVVFIAGGSGISPFRGMTKYIFDKNLDTKVSLIYGSRSPKDIILEHEFQTYLNHSNFKLFLTVDHPDENWQWHRGFIDANFIMEAVNKEINDKTYFIIGPALMVTSVKEALLSLGINEDIIRIDAWG